MNLKYKKLIANKVSFEKSLSIAVDSSASPLFYKLKTVKKIKRIEIKGKIDINKAINFAEDDAYFQFGIIYAGDYRPGSFVRAFLPEWLLKVLDLNSDYGVGAIDFYAVSAEGNNINKHESIRSIKINFQTSTYLNAQGEFSMEIKPKPQKILGFWLRADGDNSNAKFKTYLYQIKLTD